MSHIPGLSKGKCIDIFLRYRDDRAAGIKFSSVPQPCDLPSPLFAQITEDLRTLGYYLPELKIPVLKLANDGIQASWVASEGGSEVQGLELLAKEKSKRELKAVMESLNISLVKINVNGITILDQAQSAKTGGPGIRMRGRDPGLNYGSLESSPAPSKLARLKSSTSGPHHAERVIDNVDITSHETRLQFMEVNAAVKNNKAKDDMLWDSTESESDYATEASSTLSKEVGYRLFTEAKQAHEGDELGEAGPASNLTPVAIATLPVQAKKRGLEAWLIYKQTSMPRRDTDNGDDTAASTPNAGFSSTMKESRLLAEKELYEQIASDLRGQLDQERRQRNLAEKLLKQERLHIQKLEAQLDKLERMDFEKELVCFPLYAPV
ncbi:unnamed protein product [Somion occarium]|uniref:Uncharacterized protein n=1 Tax=Somion occarium TaxID=3059160 RepID=A0ABP1DVS2_9APHY